MDILTGRVLRHHPIVLQRLQYRWHAASSGLVASPNPIAAILCHGGITEAARQHVSLGAWSLYIGMSS